MSPFSLNLYQKALRRCLENNGLTSLSVFNACLQQRQQPDDVNACTTLYQATSRCANKWTGPRKYCGN
jgi:hypothetical protein